MTLYYFVLFLVVQSCPKTKTFHKSIFVGLVRKTATKQQNGIIFTNALSCLKKVVIFSLFFFFTFELSRIHPLLYSFLLLLLYILLFILSSYIVFMLINNIKKKRNETKTKWNENEMKRKWYETKGYEHETKWHDMKRNETKWTERKLGTNTVEHNI